MENDKLLIIVLVAGIFVGLFTVINITGKLIIWNSLTFYL